MHIEKIKPTKICWLAFAIGQLLLWQNVDAASRTHSSAPRVRVGRSHVPNDRAARDDYRSGYIAGLHDGTHVQRQSQRSRRDAQAAEKYALREQAERDARAERIYRNSQLSAPIILDAKACKRIGVHGESIYENCQLAQTCNIRAGVATCHPSS